MTTDKQPPSTARLVGFHVRPEHPLPPPLQHVGAVNVDDPPGNLVGWGVHVRGATVFLESPPGWVEHKATNKHIDHCNKNGPRRIFGPIALANVTLVWEGPSWEAIEKAMSRYDLPEVRRKLREPADEVRGIDPKELGDP